MPDAAPLCILGTDVSNPSHADNKILKSLRCQGEERKMTEVICKLSAPVEARRAFTKIQTPLSLIFASCCFHFDALTRGSRVRRRGKYEGCAPQSCRDPSALPEHCLEQEDAQISSAGRGVRLGPRKTPQGS